MAVQRYASNFKERTDVLDSITPKVVINRDISAPAGEWKPAPWLPVQFTKSNISQGTDGYVISSGKVVGMDSEGYIVPAGLRPHFIAGGTLVYTATDVTYGVIDLTTGETLTGAVIYTQAEVAQALIERGLVLEAEAATAGATIPRAGAADDDIICALFLSYPVGIAAYDILVWGGLPEDGDQVFTNYQKQHLVQFLTEAQVEVPFAALSAATETVAISVIDGAGTETYLAGDFVGATEYWAAAEVYQLSRYSGILTAASPVVALGLDPAGTTTQYRVAANTDRTPFTCDTTGIVTVGSEKASPDLIASEDDWCLDDEVGVLFIHSDAWATQVAAVSTPIFSYDYYTTTAASAHRYVHFDGPAIPGDWVAYDTMSNLRQASAAEVAAGLVVIGRIHAIKEEPRDLLDKVKTGFNFTGVSAAAQMPGSATKGFSDKITLTQETVADRLAVVTVRV